MSKYISESYITATGSGSLILPGYATRVVAEAWGAGGTGATSGDGGGGGAGGNYSRSAMTVPPFATIYYYVASAPGQSSWVNFSQNSPPAFSSSGCLATSGPSASGTNAGLASTTGCIGNSIYSGGNGGAGSTSYQYGGAGGGGGAGSGGTGGNGPASASGPTDGGGPGGAAGTFLIVDYSSGSGGSGGLDSAWPGSGNNGVQPGGGGGGGSGGNSGGSGGAGQIRISYNRRRITITT